MKKRILLLLFVVLTCLGSAQTQLTLPQLNAIWNTPNVPKGLNNTNTWYSLLQTLSLNSATLSISGGNYVNLNFMVTGASITGALTPGYTPYAIGTRTLTNGPLYTDGTNVSLGTTSLTSTFNVLGSFRYIYGTPGVGKIIADDGTGVGIMAWTTATLSGGGSGTITGTTTAGYIPFSNASNNIIDSPVYTDGINRFSIGATTLVATFQVVKNSSSPFNYSLTIIPNSFPSVAAYNTNSSLGDGVTTFNYSGFAAVAGYNEVRSFFGSEYNLNASGYFPATVVASNSNHPIRFLTNTSGTITASMKICTNTGYVGIGSIFGGTIDATARLDLKDISGLTLRVRDGNEGVGKVLMDNGAGTGIVIWGTVTATGTSTSTVTLTGSQQAVVTGTNNTYTITVGAATITATGAATITTTGNNHNINVTVQTLSVSSTNVITLTGSGQSTINTLPGLYRTRYIPSSAMVAKVIAGASGAVESYTTNAIMSEYYAFVSTASVSVQFQYVFPDEYDLSTLKIKLHYTTVSTSTTTGVVWGVSAVALGDGSAIDASLGTMVTVTDLPHGKDILAITGTTGALTIGGSPAMGNVIVFNIARITSDASDDNTSDMKLWGITVQYKESTTAPTIW